MRVISCLSPRIAYISKQSVNPSTGNRIISFGAKIKYDPDVWQEVAIPCGKCVECRMAYAREWANRCMVEAQYHTYNWFVTLTYNDDNVPVADYGHLTLDKKALTGFFKRLRKNTGQNIRYYACGEYGSTSFRPHYHCIIFGLSLSDLIPWRHDQRGYDIYRSPTIERAWSVDGVSLGNCELGAVTWDSCCYVARYVQKKIGQDPAAYEKLGIVPEFVRMSRRPGIGYQYFQDHFSEIYNYNEVYLATENGGIKFKPPRYYDKQLEKMSPEVMREIKDDRLKSFNGKSFMDLPQLNNTDLDYFEYNKLRESNIKDRIKSLERKL